MKIEIFTFYSDADTNPLNKKCAISYHSTGCPEKTERCE